MSPGRPQINAPSHRFLRDKLKPKRYQKLSKFVPLAKDQHAKLRVIQSGDYTRYRQQNLIPIVVRDFFTLSAEFPLVFVTNESTEDFMPVAIMGLQEGKNIYCQEEPFPAQVIPVGFGNAPFAITATDEKREQFAVLIDEESSLLSESEGDRVFTDDGEKTEYMEARVEGLVQAAQQHHQTQEITKYLVEKSLLTTQQVRLQHRPMGGFTTLMAYTWWTNRNSMSFPTKISWICAAEGSSH